MSDIMNLNVRLRGSLKDYVAHEIQSGEYDNISEYIRDLIRRDKMRNEHQIFKAKKAALQQAFAAPDSDYSEVSAEDIFARNAPDK